LLQYYWNYIMIALARTSSNCKRQTHPLIREYGI
jgi:hypothetical protein